MSIFVGFFFLIFLKKSRVSFIFSCLKLDLLEFYLIVKIFNEFRLCIIYFYGKMV